MTLIIHYDLEFQSDVS